MTQRSAGIAQTSSSLDAAKQPFPGWPVFGEDEIAAVERVLRSGKVNYWTGTEARAFEREYAAHVGVSHAVALANGTVALELALVALGIGPGHEVITSPRTFIASASCIVMRGAKPVFADVDRDSQNITAAEIERVATPRTKAIVVVHLAGWPCDMDPILEFAEARGIHIIEDCAQANGAMYKRRPVGSFGTFGAFSFCQDKIITTGGEGGLLATRDSLLWSKAWSFKDHGKSFEAMSRPHGHHGFKWVHESFGTNWRMTEMQAALGRVQLAKLYDRVGSRRANADRLREILRSIEGLRVPEPNRDFHHAYYRLYAFLDGLNLKNGWSRDRIVGEIAARGVPCFVGSCSEVYLEKAFEGTDWCPAERLPVARELGETSLTFLTHPTLGLAHMERAGAVAAEVIRSATA